MAKKKYYAVKKGKKTGIFTTWDQCKAQIHGFSGAVYKSFPTLAEAQAYLNNEMNDDKNVRGESDNTSIQQADGTYKTLVTYVDGSYSHSNRLYSYGCVLLAEDEVELSGIGNDAEMLTMRNVSGELLGSIQAINWAIANGYERIIIHHDYEGIARWATGDWKANKEGTKKYVEFINQKKQLIKIEFVKVKAHSGDKYNEEADRLAKEAIEQAVQV